MPPPDVQAIRQKLGLSQSEFAGMLGISPATLRNWEQGRRTPEGPARVLLLVADRHPELIWQVVRASSQRPYPDSTAPRAHAAIAEPRAAYRLARKAGLAAHRKGHKSAARKRA